ncbi:hypothetical protein RCL_jg763.t1 [Rhizophagus clarus]|uniref:Uncharacterized protein n=1 Tax=Rhizophagus clarus TaxID=94130 RepID=A0A8H3QLJ9_9GLOM|nr:hypothetical protein RCL_jg763.t1 [Rhizophagus clarus]
MITLFLSVRKKNFFTYTRTELFNLKSEKSILEYINNKTRDRVEKYLLINRWRHGMVLCKLSKEKTIWFLRIKERILWKHLQLDTKTVQYLISHHPKNGLKKIFGTPEGMIN